MEGIRHLPQKFDFMKSPGLKSIPVIALLAAFPSHGHADEPPNAAPVPEHELVTPATSGAAGEAAMRRWNDAKFGLFLHWGVYSVYGGSYKGKELWSAEWIQENARIPFSEYAKTAASWNPAEFDADAWARLAKSAGMGYLVITARHHDGFAIYPSKASAYHLFSSGVYKGPDPLAALKEACGKHGLLFGIYYSPLEFRSSPRGFDDEDEKAVSNGFDYRSLGPEPHATNAEVVALAQAQIKELAEWYQPDILWFDGTWDKMGQWTDADAKQAEATIRAAVPNVIINNRLGGKSADFNTFENKIPSAPPVASWEYCWNMGAFWGYNPRNYRPDLVKTPEHYIETLVRIASLGGNYLLNVGPDPTGKFHPMAVDYLTRIGAWVNVHGEAVRGTTAGPFKQDFSWGYTTMRGGALYLFVRNPPSASTRIRIPALNNHFKGAAMIGAPGSKVSVTTAPDQWIVETAGGAKPQPFMVIRIEVDGVPALSSPS